MYKSILLLGFTRENRFREVYLRPNKTISGNQPHIQNSAAMGTMGHNLISLLIISMCMVYVLSTLISYIARLHYAPRYARFPNLDLQTNIHPSAKVYFLYYNQSQNTLSIRNTSAGYRACLCVLKIRMHPA